MTTQPPRCHVVNISWKCTSKLTGANCRVRERAMSLFPLLPHCARECGSVAKYTRTYSKPSCGRQSKRYIMISNKQSRHRYMSGARTCQYTRLTSARCGMQTPFGWPVEPDV